MDAELQAQANKAATQGQQDLAQYKSQASNFTNQYNDYSNKTNEAQQGLKDFTNTMVDPNAMYRGALDQARTDVGYDPEAARNATANLIRGQSALNQINADSQRGVGGSGLTASQAAAMYGSQIQPVQQGVQNANGAVGAYNNLYQNVLSQAGTQAQQGYQQQALKETSLKDVVSNALAQQQQAGDMMNFYSDMAQKQGGLNATQAQLYATAQQAMASAKAALAQASLFAAQGGLATAQTTGQNLTNKQTQDSMGSQAYQNMLKYGQSTVPTSAPVANASKNSGSSVNMSQLGGALSGFSIGNLLNPGAGVVGGVLGASKLGAPLQSATSNVANSAKSALKKLF